MTDKIIVIGSLKPEKEVQDRTRVLSGGGICQALRATDYKDPPKVLVCVEKVKRYGSKADRECHADINKG